MQVVMYDYRPCVARLQSLQSLQLRYGMSKGLVWSDSRGNYSAPTRISLEPWNFDVDRRGLPMQVLRRA